jgi:hypothetical protein
MHAILACFWIWTTTIVIGSLINVANVRFSRIPSCVHLSHPRNPSALVERKKAVSSPKPTPRRRHTEAAWQLWPIRDVIHIPRVTFSGAVTITLAIVRLKFLRAKSPKKAETDTPPPSPRPLCGGWYCAYTLLNGPLVV